MVCLFVDEFAEHFAERAMVFFAAVPCEQDDGECGG